jgi:AbiV family abortive infection protein
VLQMLSNCDFQNARMFWMADRKLKQFRGFLTADQVAAGMTCARQNAKRLAQDAQLLFDAERYPSALSLAVLSLEESGKAFILREMATATIEKEILELWKRYRRHTAKHILTLMPERIAKGARRLIEFKECVDDSAQDEKETYDALKQLGFYTDCLGMAHWSIPVEVIDPKLAGMLVQFAVAFSSHERETTPREIELWVTHMQDCLSKPNLINWAKAMVAEGIQPQGYAEELDDFTFGLR